MSKARTLHELANLLAIALRHKIGSIVNQNEIYAQKYARDYEILLKEAEKIAEQYNWSSEDKSMIKQETRKKLQQELEKKDFLDNKKFEIMGKEMDNALKILGLD
jgi:hypothetical protein